MTLGGDEMDEHHEHPSEVGWTPEILAAADTFGDPDAVDPVEVGATVRLARVAVRLEAELSEAEHRIRVLERRERNERRAHRDALARLADAHVVLERERELTDERLAEIARLQGMVERRDRKLASLKNVDPPTPGRPRRTKARPQADGEEPEGALVLPMATDPDPAEEPGA